MANNGQQAIHRILKRKGMRRKDDCETRRARGLERVRQAEQGGAHHRVAHGKNERKAPLDLPCRNATKCNECFVLTSGTRVRWPNDAICESGFD